MKQSRVLPLLLALLFLPFPAYSQTAPKTQSQDSTRRANGLTLDQVKSKIRIYISATNEQNKEAIDAAVAAEISETGVQGFQPNGPIINELRKLGAGPQTIRALESLKSRTAGIVGQQGTAPEKIVILVANFSGAANTDVTEQILDQLRQSTNKYRDIVIKALGEEITAQDGDELATAKGKEQGANIVLWGRVATTKTHVRITARFEVIGGLQNINTLYSDALDGNQIFTGGLADLDDFTIQVPLSKELTAITLFATGLARIAMLDSKSAISQFTEALRQAQVAGQKTNSTQITNISDIYLARGMAYFTDSILHQGTSSKDAHSDFSEIIRTNDKHSPARLLRAFNYMAGDSYDEAIADVKKVLEYESDVDTLTAAAYVMAMLYLLKEDDEKAKQYFDLLLQKYEGSADQPFTYLLRGQAYVGKKDFISAFNTFEIGLQRSDIPVLKAAFYFNKGLVYLLQKDPEKAIPEFDEALRLDPNLVFAYALRGKAHAEKGRFGMAIRDYDESLKRNPNLADLYVDRGYAYYRSGDKAKAIGDYDHALKLKQDLKMAFYHRGNTYLSQGQNDKAIADFTSYLKIEPDDVEVLVARASLYANQKHLDGAIADYTRLTILTPNDARPFFSRGYAFETKGLRDKALIDYNEAIKLDGSNFWTFLFRGKLYVALGERALAISDFQKVLQMTDLPKAREDAQQQLNLLGIK